MGTEKTVSTKVPKKTHDRIKRYAKRNGLRVTRAYTHAADALEEKDKAPKTEQ